VLKALRKTERGKRKSAAIARTKAADYNGFMRQMLHWQRAANINRE
jgi:hypothetical protein